MGQASIIIRPAGPVFEEGMAYARYVDMAAEGFIRLMYGPEYERIIAEAFTRPGNEYSFENVIVAERGGEIAGMASGFTAERRSQFPDDPVKDSAGSAATRIRLVKLLFRPMMRIVETIAAGDFYIPAAAVDGEQRGLGMGTLLLDAMEARAREVGAVRLALDVAHDNAGARKLYERRGMTVESQWPKRLAISKLRFYRMVKTL